MSVWSVCLSEIKYFTRESKETGIPLDSRPDIIMFDTGAQGSIARHAKA